MTDKDKVLTARAVAQRADRAFLRTMRVLADLAQSPDVLREIQPYLTSGGVRELRRWIDEYEKALTDLEKEKTA